MNNPITPPITEYLFNPYFKKIIRNPIIRMIYNKVIRLLTFLMFVDT
jgi:hypothetical protein